MVMQTNASAERTARAAPSRLVVTGSAIAANTRTMRALAETPLMAVVKADGFGLGAEVVARAAIAGGASELGVATCEEALALREAGIEVPILVWMLHPGAPLDAALRAGITLSCASLGQLEAVRAAAADAGITAVIELEVETGMHRSGCPEGEWSELLRVAAHAQQQGELEVRGVWTHFGATSLTAIAFAHPLERLDAAWRAAVEAGLQPRRHAASSLATSVAPESRLDVVRVGAALFGVEPDPAHPVGLEATVRWETSVAQVRDVAESAAVGYGGTYRTGRAARLALLPVGYADGVPRHGWPGLEVGIGGRRFPVVGAISMDQCVVDVGDAPVEVGDRVVLLGDGSAGEPSLSEWSAILGTIPQEVLTGVGTRVARIVEGDYS